MTVVYEDELEDNDDDLFDLFEVREVIVVSCSWSVYLQFVVSVKENLSSLFRT